MRFDGLHVLNLNPPDFGYSVKIQMAIDILELSNKQYAYFDNGQLNDTRILKIPAFTMSKTDATTLSSFLLSAVGRDEYLTLDLQTDRGFFPAGPDKGNSGKFFLKLLNRDISELLDDPYMYFKLSFEFVVIPENEFTLPARIPEGLFKIADIEGLRYPGFRPKNKYSLNSIAGYGGEVSAIDDGANVWETSFDQICNNSNAGHLLSFLTGIYGRTNSFKLTGQSNYYIFGVDNSDSGEYDVKLVTNSITVKHERFNTWNIPLKVWKL